MRDTVVARLGPGVLGRDGDVDRSAVARAIFGDDDLRSWLEQFIHPLVHEEAVAWRDAALAADPPPRAVVEEVQLLFEGGRVDAYDRTRRHQHRAADPPRPPGRPGSPGGPRRPRGAAAAGGPEGRARRRRDRQRRRRRRPRPGGCRLPRPRRTAMKRFFLWFAAFMAVIGLAAAYGLSQEPDWYVRARYPLHFEKIVRVHADNYDLDPALVAAVIYAESKFDPATRSSAGAVGPHAAAAGDGAGHRRPHRRRALHRGRPGRSRHQRALRVLVPAPPARQVPRHGRRRPGSRSPRTTRARRTWTSGSRRRRRASRS